MTITLKGREIPLLYTTYEMKTIQQEICPIGEFVYLLFGRKQDDKKNEASLYLHPEHLDAVIKAIRILGNAGIEEAGQAPDLTDKWVGRALKPQMMMEAMQACIGAINEGMESEIPEKEDGEPVDVTLEEMKKKETKDG